VPSKKNEKTQERELAIKRENINAVTVPNMEEFGLKEKHTIVLC